MAAVANALTHGFVETKFAAEIPRTFALSCGVALVGFSLFTSYGIDLSPGLF
jgi:hypothetical protein